MKRSLTLYAETLPIYLNPSAIFEHAGEVIARLIHLPLLELDERLRPSRICATRRFWTGASAKHWFLNLRQDVCTASGERLDAFAIARVLNAQVREAGCEICRWLIDNTRCPEGPFEATAKNMLEIQLLSPVQYLPALLESKRFLIDTASDGRSRILARNSCGSYHLDKLSPHRWILSRNPYADCEPHSPEEIHFIKIRNLAHPDFGSNDQCTRLTDLFRGHYESFEEQKLQWRRIHHKLLMFACLREVKKKEKKRRLELRKGGASVRGMSTVAFFSDAFWSEKTEPTRSPMVNSMDDTGGTLAYADFAPNSLAAAEIATRIPHRQGVEVRLVAHNWNQYLEEMRNPKADYLLSIEFPDFKHVMAVVHCNYTLLRHDPRFGELVRIAPLDAAAYSKEFQDFVRGIEDVANGARGIQPIFQYAADAFVSSRDCNTRYDERGMLRLQQ